MAFSLSPSVIVIENDLTGVIPAVSTSAGAYAGVFEWGPVLTPITVSSESTLVSNFGLPRDGTFVSFYTAYNFLAYSNNLSVTRIFTSGLRTANSTPGTTNALIIKNEDDYTTNNSSGTSTNGQFAAKYPGALGNGLKVEIADSSTYSSWAYKNMFTGAPGTSAAAAALSGSNDEVHVVVIDSLGKFSGVKDQVLERFAYASKSKDAVNSDGTNNYYKNVINTSSEYVWWLSHPTAGTNWGTGLGTAFASLGTAFSTTLTGGADDFTATDGEIMTAYDLYKNTAKYDVSLIIMGKASATVASYVIQNIAEVRKDCVVFVSPELVADGGVIIGEGDDVVADILAYREALNISSSYAFMDSGWKYQYDKYNDLMRWIPLNADIAGLAARTDYTNDPWWSIAGYNRGKIKNVWKLGSTIGKTEADAIYPKGINPVVIESIDGCILMGDRTLLAKPSAFDRINVRRLFIVLEKAIATAAKYQLFEFNDSFTRAQFVNLVTPFLRDVQGRRGVIDFSVICDERNNTAQVIDSNQFVGTILIKPNKSINTIVLNFTAVNTAASFTELG